MGFKFALKHLKNKNQGFTLIEILIAITILSLLMVGVYSLVDNSARLQTTMKVEDDLYLQLDTALQRFGMDFSHLYSPLFYSVPYKSEQNTINIGTAPSNSPATDFLKTLKKFKPSERFEAISKRGHIIPTVQNEDKSSFVFMTSVNQRKLQNSKQSNFAWVRYSLKASEEGGDLYELIRQYSPENIYAPDFNWDQIKEQILFSRLRSFEFHFWHKEKEKFQDRLSDLDKDKLAPRLVKIKLAWVDLNGIPTEEERSYRVMWNQFDAVKDDKEYMKALQEGQGPANPNDPTTPPGFNPNEDDDE